MPKDFVAMDEKEKAFVIACIDIKVENEKRAQEKAERGRS